MTPNPRLELPASSESVPPAVHDALPIADPREPVRLVAPPPPRRATAERVTWVDWALVGLAVLSLLLLVAEAVVPRYLADPAEVLRWLILADVAICGVFAIEFFARMRGQPSKWAYAKSRWYDILGMIPVSHPMFRGFRLVRVLRIVVITSRFVRATNRSFGEMVFEGTVLRFRDRLVDLIGGAVVLRGIAMMEPWLVRARFAEQIGAALEHRRPDIRRMVHDAMGRLPIGGRLMALGPVQSIVATAETAAVQAVIDVLKSDELNRVVQQSTENVLAELRVRVSEQDRRALLELR